MNNKVRQLRKEILKASYKAGACHIGSAMSCVELMAALFYGRMGKRDLFIFSKASGAATYYAILADKGYFPKHKLATYLKNYPEASKEVPGVRHSVGSVGHGLAVAVGLAYSNRSRKVYCLISDGECQEGVTWEALMFASQHNLNNLIVFVDNNQIQACGNTQEIINLEPLAKKFEAFDCYADTVNGHSFIEINGALDFVEYINCQKPIVIVANTVKGKGIDFMENDYNWHYKNLTEAIYKNALCQI